MIVKREWVKVPAKSDKNNYLYVRKNNGRINTNT